jgi:hypothetical protein
MHMKKKIKEKLVMTEYTHETFDRSSNDDETVRSSNAYWKRIKASTHA